ncbi:hypothetical protein M422DRAFT_264489 [Sphaerobolus stellatus SS14]|uniref:Uncharacterized protein n=1 Tax=Sphaerobolus stellatus (strain SS14) TaxID=990650 RepID=A0A0C9UWC1_SPHS4|nr:hypothetical protein M422DRAFT_264489 [Sphaerobolus stellatus SS14]
MRKGRTIGVSDHKNPLTTQAGTAIARSSRPLLNDGPILRPAEVELKDNLQVQVSIDKRCRARTKERQSTAPSTSPVYYASPVSVPQNRRQFVVRSKTDGSDSVEVENRASSCLPQSIHNDRTPCTCFSHPHLIAQQSYTTAGSLRDRPSDERHRLLDPSRGCRPVTVGVEETVEVLCDAMNLEWTGESASEQRDR